MKILRRIPIAGLFVILCALSMQMVAPHLLLAADTMTLTAAPESLVADGVTASVITATVSNGPTPEQGVGLTFVIVTNRGSLSSTTAISNTAGRALVTLTSTSVGVAIVTCTTSGTIISNSVAVTFTKPPDPPDPPDPPLVLTSFVLSVDPPSVAADNLTPSTISAQLYDQDGNTLSQAGVSVVFTTSFTTSPAAHFANGSTTISVSTDATGTAKALLYSPTVGIATINAFIGSLTTDPVYVNFTGSGPAAFISLSAAPSWIPADGYSYTAITATILDSAGKPVSAGTAATFTTTALGVFENGKQTYSAVTSDDTGTVTVRLKAASTAAIGTAVITCTVGSAVQSLSVNLVRLEYETEPNNDRSQADAICFDNVFLSQLSSPYEEDWYTFTITQPSRIGVNFITTAIPKIAGDCIDSTTVGTYRVDIRDVNNNVLMSYQNIDCIFDNGIWETGVVPVGTYYVVVFCPRLPDSSHYLSTPYYLAVFNNLYLPCGGGDKLVNAASLSLETSAYQLHVPAVNTTPYLWADFQYDPISASNLMFRLTNFGVLKNLNDFRSCNLSSLSLVGGNYVLHVPVVIFEGVSYRVDFIYVPTMDGSMWFMLSGAWVN